MFLKLMEFFFVFVLAWFIITQIIWPFLRGTAFFPIFRRERNLGDKIVDLKQRELEEALEKEIEEKEQGCSNCSSSDTEQVCQSKKSPNYKQKVRPAMRCDVWSDGRRRN